jgi:sec-independent protein translocase protein TatA
MGLGIGELIVIFLIVLVIFGAGKLPAIGDALGRSIKNFKKATNAEDEVVDVTPRRDALPPVSEKSVPAPAADEARKA